MIDAQAIVEGICEGRWPEEHFTPDELVVIINRAGNYFVELGAPDDPEIAMDEINNFALWIGGLHKDFQVYAWQLVRRYHNIEVYGADTTAVRLWPIEDKIFEFLPYEVEDASGVIKSKWPREFTNTFEERVEALHEVFCAESNADALTVDLILTGQARGEESNIDHARNLVIECCEELQALINKYGKPNILYWEKAESFFAWANAQGPELAIFSYVTFACQFKLPVEFKDMPSYVKFSETFQDMILGN